MYLPVYLSHRCFSLYLLLFCRPQPPAPQKKAPPPSQPVDPGPVTSLLPETSALDVTETERARAAEDSSLGGPLEASVDPPSLLVEGPSRLSDQPSEIPSLIDNTLMSRAVSFYIVFYVCWSAAEIVPFFYTQNVQLYYYRVPSFTGKPGKPGKPVNLCQDWKVREKSGTMKMCQKVREKSGKFEMELVKSLIRTFMTL